MLDKFHNNIRNTFELIGISKSYMAVSIQRIREGEVIFKLSLLNKAESYEVQTRGTLQADIGL